MADYTGTRTFAYNLAGTLELQYEDLPTFFDSRRIAYGYDTATGVKGRYNQLNVTNSAKAYDGYSMNLGYDASGRPNAVWAYTYVYTANSHRIASISHSSYAWTQTRTYLSANDTLDVIETKWGATSKAKFDHTHDVLYRATTILKTGEQFSTYGNGSQGLETDFTYNDRSELTGDSTALGGTSTPLTGRDDYHAYDPIGNRTQVLRSGATVNYTPNNLNQYTSFTGSATHTYDDDGNLTNDGMWTYQWDAENRLIAQDSITHVRRLEFKYDYLGRRVQKTVREGWNGTAYTTVPTDLRYLYDGWNVLYELNAGTLAKVRGYIWGLDLSGTWQGAGGVGGLLYMHDYATSTAHLPMYDGNGNITGYTNTSGTLTAKYEYDAFGQTVVATGSAAGSTPFRFATKYADTETGLVQYNKRYYSPSLGRFIGRDTIGERGGLNLYAYVMNRVPNAYDILGMDADFRSVPRTTFTRVFLNWHIPIAQVIRVKSERELEREYLPPIPPVIPTEPQERGAIIYAETATDELRALAEAQINYIKSERLPDGGLTEAAIRLEAILAAGKDVVIYARDRAVNDQGDQGTAEPIASPGHHGAAGTFITYNVNRGNRSTAILAHEISHAYDNLFGVVRLPEGGTRQERVNSAYRDVDVKNLGGVSRDFVRYITNRAGGYIYVRDEYEAVRVENQIRELLGLDLQKIYAFGINDIRAVPDFDKYVPKKPSDGEDPEPRD